MTHTVLKWKRMPDVNKNILCKLLSEFEQLALKQIPLVYFNHSLYVISDSLPPDPISVQNYAFIFQWLTEITDEC